MKTIFNLTNGGGSAQIPARPAYGIVLNRKGAMLDQRSEGYLAAPPFQSLYQEILNKYIVTLNINLNLPEETYSGSEVDFHDPTKGNVDYNQSKPQKH